LFARIVKFDRKIKTIRIRTARQSTESLSIHYGGIL
jgi:hypothetical protein